MGAGILPQSAEALFGSLAHLSDLRLLLRRELEVLHQAAVELPRALSKLPWCPTRFAPCAGTVALLTQGSESLFSEPVQLGSLFGRQRQSDAGHSFQRQHARPVTCRRP